MKITLDLPFPPSVNTIWRSAGKGRVYLNPKYKKWKSAADAYFYMQRRELKTQRITGKYDLIVLLVKPDNRLRDLGNYSNKAIEDWLKRAGLIDDDSLCESSVARWVESDEAPIGCRVTVQSHTRSSGSKSS